ncbi:MAG TPA: alpha-glucan phosphorylase, partial [Candidatus Sericytochromatia bacterium]
KELAAWKASIFQHWYNIKIVSVDVSATEQIQVNQKVSVKALINLAGLTPNDVQIELYQGAVNADGEITNGTSVVMQHQGKDQQGDSIYTADILYSASGLQGLSLRVLPKHQNLSSPHELGLISWA